MERVDFHDGDAPLHARRSCAHVSVALVVLISGFSLCYCTLYGVISTATTATTSEAHEAVQIFHGLDAPDRLVNRALRTGPRAHADLNDVLLGKSGHLGMGSSSDSMLRRPGHLGIDPHSNQKLALPTLLHLSPQLHSPTFPLCPRPVWTASLRRVSQRPKRKDRFGKQMPKLPYSDTRYRRAWRGEADNPGVEFMGYYEHPEELPRLRMYPHPTMPEVLLLGRSNVAKISALNVLWRRGKAIHRPIVERTRSIGLFRIRRVCSIASLPGRYGFQQRNETQEDEGWKSRMTSYLNTRGIDAPIKLVVIFVDAQREPEEDDARLLKLLESKNIRTLVVAYYTDEMEEEELEEVLPELRDFLELSENQLFPFNIRVGTGALQMWMQITETAQKVDPTELKVAPIKLNDIDRHLTHIV